MKPSYNSIRTQDIDRFNEMADQWWDDHGPMRPLHAMNPQRLQFIRQSCANYFKNNTSNPIKNRNVLDIGCGGGLLCEPLARMNANVTGVDASDDLIAIAKTHAAAQNLTIDYRATTAEQLAETGQKYDVVTALEIIEHVNDPTQFIQTASRLLKQGGLLFVSTLNRTAASYLTAIIGAEYITRWLPRGTHDWRSFIKPSELKRYCDEAACDVREINGLIYNPIVNEFRLSNTNVQMNYILVAEKRDAA